MVDPKPHRLTRRGALATGLGASTMAMAQQPEELPPSVRRAAPSPSDWGANGRGTNDDTDAWQKAIDAVRGNAAYPPRHAGSPAGIVWAPAGRYTITRSLDFTTDGALEGLGIWGEGQLQTFINAELTEAFPALDMTGMSGAHLRSFQIRGSKTSKASCALLLAMDPRNSFHNRYPSVRDVWLELATDGSAVAALVVAASDLAMLDNVVCSGPIGATMGWRLPARLRFTLPGEAPEASIRVDQGLGLQAGDLVGYPIRITAGRGKGQIRSIVAFDPGARLATIDRAWSPAPDRTSNVEISAVKSRYRLAQASYDQTNYWIRNCQFVGRRGFVLTGGVAINFDDSYFAIVGRDATPRSVISIAEQDQAEDQGPLTFHARGIRTENQSDDHHCHAITTAQPNVMLDVSGELTVSPATDPTRTSGAVLHNIAPGGFDCVSISGIAGGGARLFDCTGDLSSLWSTFRADTPGRLDGRIGFAVVDWRNRAADPQWTEFLLERAQFSLSPAGLLLGSDAKVVRPGWDRSIGTSQPIVVQLPVSLPHYEGGSGLRPCRVDDVPAAMLDGSGGKRQLHCQLYGRVSGEVFALRLRQDAEVTLVTVNLADGGSSFAIDYILEVARDGGLTAAGTLTVAAGASPFLTTAQLDPRRPWSIEYCVAGPTSGPVQFGPGRVSLI